MNKPKIMAMNLLDMYIEQHKMHNCSDIIKLSNLNKSQLDDEITKADMIFKGRNCTLCLKNSPIPERFSWILS